MTPLHIRMLLHYHSIGEPYAKHDPNHADSPAVWEYRGDLLRDGLIEANACSGSGWGATPKGRAHVEALCSLPLPECRWVTPTREPAFN